MAEPLSREERAAFCAMGGGLFRDDVRRYEATVQRAEAEAEDIALGLGEALDTAKERLQRAEAALREIESKPYRAEEVIRRYREEAGGGP